MMGSRGAISTAAKRGADSGAFMMLLLVGDNDKF
jgi:hypothetical protein